MALTIEERRMEHRSIYAHFAGAVQGVVELCPGYISPADAIDRIKVFSAKFEQDLAELEEKQDA